MEGFRWPSSMSGGGLDPERFQRLSEAMYAEKSEQIDDDDDDELHSLQGRKLTMTTPRTSTTSRRRTTSAPADMPANRTMATPAVAAGPQDEQDDDDVVLDEDIAVSPVFPVAPGCSNRDTLNRLAQLAKRQADFKKRQQRSAEKLVMPTHLYASDAVSITSDSVNSSMPTVACGNLKPSSSYRRSSTSYEDGTATANATTTTIATTATATSPPPPPAAATLFPKHSTNSHPDVSNSNEEEDTTNSSISSAYWQQESGDENSIGSSVVQLMLLHKTKTQKKNMANIAEGSQLPTSGSDPSPYPIQSSPEDENADAKSTPLLSWGKLCAVARVMYNLIVRCLQVGSVAILIVWIAAAVMTPTDMIQDLVDNVTVSMDANPSTTRRNKDSSSNGSILADLFGLLSESTESRSVVDVVGGFVQHDLLENNDGPRRRQLDAPPDTNSHDASNEVNFNIIAPTTDGGGGLNMDNVHDDNGRHHHDGYGVLPPPVHAGVSSSSSTSKVTNSRESFDDKWKRIENDLTEKKKRMQAKHWKDESRTSSNKADFTFHGEDAHTDGASRRTDAGISSDNRPKRGGVLSVFWRGLLSPFRWIIRLFAPPKNINNNAHKKTTTTTTTSPTKQAKKQRKSRREEPAYVNLMTNMEHHYGKDSTWDFVLN